MKEFLRKAWNEGLGIRFAVGWNVFLLAVAAVGSLVDHRLILGLNPWIKPAKFDISVIVYLITVAALLAGLGRWPRMRAIIAWGIAVSMIVENTIISVQSLRGVRSHMNFATVHDSLAFAVMGLFIALNTMLVAWLLALWCATPTQWPRPAAWGARLGLTALLAGSIEGVLMVQRLGHTVGAPDGLAGLPFVNWSTSHGDLRVAHFFALHALQLLPLLGYAVSRVPWPERAKLATVVAAAAGYFAIVWALFRQAMAGRPLIG